jgi:putative acetyltransferase
MIETKRTDSNNPDFRLLVKELDADLRTRNGDDMQDTYDAFNIIDYLDTVVIVYHNGTPIGCGCFKPFDKDSVEIKRMFVKEQHRGEGVGRLIIKELETWAKEIGYTNAVLETGKKHVEAIALYKKQGYALTPNYGPYVGLPESVCMKKPLPG